MTGLSGPEGQKLIQQLVCPCLSHDLHDYILEGVCKALDGLHIIYVLHTGGGKTSYFYGYMMALRELQKLPTSHPTKAQMNCGYPQNPLMDIIYLTKGLEHEMEHKFISLGIPSLAINKNTLSAAWCHSRTWHPSC
ncbi:uncharacterized protein ARMOST_19933 [Armillaria ostoyae]|uniref:DEAD/DEAH box helicase domain-containing protein n=1 Tax=Armillaria ostoyae TaxID=47428 RepID=A0A284S5Y5_ARMOS|nr:uncharacterized protein ARMOST_19933 [Armillaria ostoyae]